MATRKYRFELTAREVAELLGRVETTVAIEGAGRDYTVTTDAALSTADKDKLDRLVQNLVRGHPKDLGPESFALAVARGLKPGLAIEHKFGFNPDIDTATDPEDIWDAGGIWVAPTTARTHQIVSTSTADTSAGTGARTIRVLGLDASFALQQEDVTMNGQSNVATASTYTMVYRMQVLTAGSGAENAGVITATADSDGTVTAQINATNNQTGMAIYQVPASKTAYVLNFYSSLSNSGGAGANVDVRMLIQPTGGVFQTKQFHGLVIAGGTHFNHIFPVPMKLEAKDTIKMQVKTTSANDTAVSAGFDLILVDE